MNAKKLFSRRKFLVAGAATLGGALLAWTQHLMGTTATQAQEPSLTPQAYLPIVFGPSQPLPRVVHVRDPRATSWDGVHPSYYDAVDQEVVNAMVQAGLQLLTVQEAWPDIWSVLVERVNPDGYMPGQKVAIKVNLNNSWACDDYDHRINALPQPVLALISGIVAAGVQPGDVIVYDSIRHPSIYLRQPIWAAYRDVKFLGLVPGEDPCPGVIPPSYGAHPSLTIGFSDTRGYIRDRQLVDVLYDATYVINVPIIKAHSGQNNNPVTLSFKNHFGSLNTISGSGGGDDLHNYIYNSSSLYENTYSPLADIWRNPNIRDKTVLILGDGLYGGSGWGSDPIRSWSIFGDEACNSLFFGVDPVATDCVMADLIVAEGMVTREHTYDHLFCAQETGLGRCEGTRDDPGGDPLHMPYGSGYQAIEYLRVDA
jgi:hypothetical protein